MYELVVTVSSSLRVCATEEFVGLCRTAALIGVSDAWSNNDALNDALFSGLERYRQVLINTLEIIGHEAYSTLYS